MLGAQKILRTCCSTSIWRGMSPNLSQQAPINPSVTNKPEMLLLYKALREEKTAPTQTVTSNADHSQTPPKSRTTNAHALPGTGYIYVCFTLAKPSFSARFCVAFDGTRKVRDETITVLEGGKGVDICGRAYGCLLRLLRAFR